MPNEIINKVVVGDDIIIDLDNDTLSSADQIPAGTTAHLNTGEAVEGTAEIKETTTYNIETRDETIAIEGEGGGSAYIPAGESINVGISGTERAKIIPENIAENVRILGILGTHSGGGGGYTEHPTTSGQSIFGGTLSTTATATNYVVEPTVTKIAPYAFFQRSSLTNLTLPTALTEIGDYAFQNCVGFTNTDFLANNTVDYIMGSGTMKGCSALTSINLPKCYRLGTNCFDGCTLLETAYMPDMIQLMSSSFANCTHLSSIDWGDNPQIYTIGAYAFQSCTALHDVTIPSTYMGRLGDHCFYQSGLQTISIPTLAEYTNNVFAGCTSMTSFSQPTSCPNALAGAATYVFQNNTNLESVDLTGCTDLGGVGSQATTKNASWFYGCSNLKTVVMPDAIAIPTDFFRGCTKLEEVTIANGCTVNLTTAAQVCFAHGGTYIRAKASTTASAATISIYVGTSTTVAGTMTTASPTLTMTIGDTTYTLRKVTGTYGGPRFTISW